MRAKRRITGLKNDSLRPSVSPPLLPHCLSLPAKVKDGWDGGRGGEGEKQKQFISDFDGQSGKISRVTEIIRDQKKKTHSREMRARREERRSPWTRRRDRLN